MLEEKRQRVLSKRFLISLVAVIGVFWCLRLELPRCLYIINAIQILYALLMIGRNNIKNESEKGSINYFIVFAGELLLISAFITGAYFVGPLFGPVTGSVLAVLIKLLLILFSIVIIYIFIKKKEGFYTPLLVNLIGIMGTFVVFNSNLHIITLTALEAVQRMWWTCLVTYFISAILSISVQKARR